MWACEERLQSWAGFILAKNEGLPQYAGRNIVAIKLRVGLVGFFAVILWSLPRHGGSATTMARGMRPAIWNAICQVFIGTVLLLLCIFHRRGMPAVAAGLGQEWSERVVVHQHPLTLRRIFIVWLWRDVSIETTVLTLVTSTSYSGCNILMTYIVYFGTAGYSPYKYKQKNLD